MPRQTKAATGKRTSLSRERIEEAALAVIDAEGLEGFSIRKLGDVLGCEAMSIYHHFPSKAHILDALVDRLVAGIDMPGQDMTPVERLRHLAHAWRALARRHPRFFPFFSLHRLNSVAGVSFLNEVMAALHDAGMDREAAARFFRIVNYFLMGAALDEISGYAQGPSSLSPISNEELAERFPLIADAGDFFGADQFDRTFSHGLEMLLTAAGLE